mgnify:FL=1
MNDRTKSSGDGDPTSTDSGRSGGVKITEESDILRARKAARDVVEDLSFRITDVTRIVTAVSELARNIHLYADEGTMRWRVIEDGTRSGIELTFEDDGPGISDVEGVMRAEHSTSNGMGRGIQGTKKLMDEFELATSEADGTTIRIRKWADD